MASRSQKKRQQEAAVTRWNAAHEVGALVSVLLDDDTVVETRTRSAAQMLSGHTAVVWLEGITGCYLLSRVDALPQPDKAHPTLKTEVQTEAAP